MKLTSGAAVVAALLFITPLSPATASASCSGYTNVDDHCVSSPDHGPGDYHDGDGTNSHSEHSQGSGSWHGGTGGHHSKK